MKRWAIVCLLALLAFQARGQGFGQRRASLDTPFILIDRIYSVEVDQVTITQYDTVERDVYRDLHVRQRDSTFDVRAVERRKVGYDTALAVSIDTVERIVDERLRYGYDMPPGFVPDTLLRVMVDTFLDPRLDTLRRYYRADTVFRYYGDTTYRIWKTKGAVSLNFANVGLENWSGGGEGSFSVGTNSQFEATLETHRSEWKTNLEIAYGLIRREGDERGFIKSDDKLRLRTQYSHKFNRHWSLTTAADLTTQIDAGFNYVERTDDNGDNFWDATLISRFMAPGYLLLTCGWEFNRQSPTRDFRFSSSISPVTGKVTFVLDQELADQGAFGVEPGRQSRSELGPSLSNQFEWEVFQNVSFRSDLDLFANFETVDNVDVVWQTRMAMKVNKHLSANFSTHLIYDDDVDIQRDDGTTYRAVQFKHVLNVSVGFIF